MEEIASELPPKGGDLEKKCACWMGVIQYGSHWPCLYLNLGQLKLNKMKNSALAALQ